MISLKTSRTTFLAFTLAGCSSMNINQFAAGQPAMSPQNWMVGTVDGYGIITDRFGNVKSQFHAHEVGTWDPATSTVTLTEHINYLQGSTAPPTDRIWHFTETSNGNWTGTADDVIGTAIAQQQGNAWHLVFHQKLPVGSHQLEVTVDDWRIRESDNVALDTSTISKFGIHLATAQIAFIKSD